MNTEEIQAKIMELVRRSDWVSFVEVDRMLKAAGMDPSGEIAICSPRDSNVVFWAGVSDAYVDAISGLLKDKKLFLHISDPFSYMIDGGGLSFPLAKRLPKDGYKTRRWLPVCLRTVTPEGVTA